MNIPCNQFSIFGILGHFVVMDICIDIFLCPEQETEIKSPNKFNLKNKKERKI